MDNDFDSVSWQNEPDSDVSRPNIIGAHDSEDRAHGMSSSGKRKPSHSANQAGDNADAVDLAGIGEGRLDCTVNIPMKENDGTKDAYVSYLVTTNVRLCSFRAPTPSAPSFEVTTS